MSALPREKLAELIVRYGPELASDARRCENLLKDFCPNPSPAHKREISVLVGAVKEAIPLEMLGSTAATTKFVLLSRLSVKLHENQGVTESLARWAVESWALALGIAGTKDFHFPFKCPACAAKGIMLSKLAGQSVPCPKCKISVLISPDDRWLVVGQSHGDAGALVFDSRTGEKRFNVWPRHGTSMTRVQSLAIDRDSAVLAAVCSDNVIPLSRFESGKEWTIPSGSNVKRVLSLSFSPTNKNLVAGLDPFGEGKGKPFLKVWNLETGREPFSFKTEHSARVAAVDFCAGGHQVASGSHDKRVVMWNAETGRIWRELHTEMTIRALACSPQGRTIAVAGVDGTKPQLQFWDYAAGTLLATEPSPHGSCQCVAFSRNGELLVSGSGSQVMLWNPETRKLLATLAGHSHDVTAAAFTAEGGILITGGVDQTIRLWDVSRFLSPRSE